MKTYDIKLNIKGYTLIELAIVIIIAGLALAGAGNWFKVQQRQQALAETEANISTVVNALGGYRTMFGRYPCPASLEMNQDDLLYGHEGTECSAATAYSASNIGTLTNGVLIEQSNRSYDVGNPPVNVTPRVIRGAVPFRILNLPEDSAYDGYGNRIYYAVTEPLTVAEEFDARNGGISILAEKDPLDLSAIEPEHSAHFVVFSAGENGLGAYSRAGEEVANCPTPLVVGGGGGGGGGGGAPAGSTGQVENENCDTQGNATYLAMAVRNDNTGSGTYDDRVAYYTRGDMPLWRYSDISGNEEDVLVSHGVGVGADPSLTSAAMLVGGSLRAYDSLYAGQICDNDGYCFPVKKIAGDSDDPDPESGMKCPDDDPDGTGDYMVAIVEGKPVCEDLPDVDLTCPTGEVLTGISQNGAALEPICQSATQTGCTSEIVNLCGEDKTLASIAQGGKRTISAGYSAWEKYYCNQNSWTLNDSGGLCVCIPGQIEENWIACAPGFTGQRLISREMDCDAGTWTNWVEIDVTDCECVPDQKIDRWECPPPLSGAGRYMYNNWVCDSPTSGHWEGWQEDTSRTDCSCVPEEKTVVDDCPDGLTGSVTRKYKLNCTTGEWTLISETEDCHCLEKTEYDDTRCPGNQIGVIVMQRDFTCPAQTWSNWYEISRVCKPAPLVTCSWENTGVPTFGQTSRTGALRGSPCACGTPEGPCYDANGSGVYTNYSDCVCK